MHLRHQCIHAQRGAAGPRTFRLAGDEARWSRTRAFSLDDLALDLALDLEGKSVSGEAVLTVRRVDPEARWAELDAIEFALDAVEREHDEAWTAAAHEYDGEVLRVDLADLPDGGVTRLRVAYRATPRRGLYFTAPDEHRPDRPTQVWSQCQDQDGRHWFPCQDHPGQRMTTAMSVVVPRGWFALSNGVLTERGDVDGGTRFAWVQSEPHPAYLVTLAAGDFDEAHTEVGGLPVDYYVPKGRGGAIERSLGRTPEMIRVFAERLSTPFPWAKYAQVVVADFIFGGMENTSATTLFERALLDERAALDVDMDSLVAHELGHQWFGDLVTCREWTHAWLNEGFATYMEHVWKEHQEGRDAYLYNLEMDLELYLAEYDGRYGRAIVERHWDTPIDIFDRHLYQKGGLFLHVLRETLGDVAFWRGLTFYLERHRGGSVETRDLLRSLEDATGRSLEEIFHQWVERPGHPVLKVRAQVDDDAVTVTVSQEQAGDRLFHLRVPVIVGTDGGRERHVLEIARKTETFRVPTSGRARMVVVDPDMVAPGKIELGLPVPMLVAQLEDGDGARARWMAARALGKKNEPRAGRALAAALADDPFWAVRLEAAKALGEQRTPEAFAALCAAEGDPDPKARRGVARALGAFRDAAAADRLLAWIERGDRSYMVEAELRRALGATRDPRAREVLARSLAEDGGSWGEVVRCGAADGLAKLRDPATIEPLLGSLADLQTESTIRRAVLAALADVREVESDKTVLRSIREVAEEQLGDYDPNVRIAVARLFAALGHREGFTVLRRMADRDLDGRVRRASRESLKDLSAAQASPPELAALRDEVDTLRREVSDLRAQVASTVTPAVANDA
ncbi:MAG: HEAT repeat domain-containing protein [Sandaracinaceae bacterium]|nr:HEAT repeat domain-containing protein [Sandaracinaceae bacterium]